MAKDERLSEALLCYGDIETAYPSDYALFWYAELKNAETGERVQTTDFKEYWQALVEKPKGRQKLVGFYNAGYDMGTLSYHAQQEFGYKVNPCEYWPINNHESTDFEEQKDGVTTKRPSCIFNNHLLKHHLGAQKYAKESREGRIKTLKGLKETIYEGQVYEIYTSNVIQPAVRVFDTKPSMTGGIESWGEILGKPKGDTPKNNVGPDLEVREKDWMYVSRDVDIQHEVYELLGNADALKQGLLTESSMAQDDLKQRLGKVRKGDDYKHRSRGIPTTFAAKKEKKTVAKPLPTAVKEKVEEEVNSLYAQDLKERTDENGEVLYGTDDMVFEKVRKIYKRHYAKALENTYGKGIRKSQTLAHKKLKGVKLSKEEDKEVQAYYELPLPRVREKNLREKGWKVVVDYHLEQIKIAVNERIHPAMKGGISTPNWKYASKVVGAGTTADANSMYPSILRYIEVPTEFVGMQKEGKPDMKKFFIARIKTLKATVKEDCHPWVKGATKYNKNARYYENTVSWTEKDLNALTSVEIEHLYLTYDVEELTFGSIYYFKSDPEFTKAVHDYIDYWQAEKLQADEDMKPYLEKAARGEKLTEEETLALNRASFARQRAKMRLNTLWGRWAMFVKSVAQGADTVDIGDKDTQLVSGIFTTAYARIWLNRVSNAVGTSFVYSDTDSVHIVYREDGIKNKKHLYEVLGSIIDPSKFGYWKPEKDFIQAKYIRSKQYAHVRADGSIEATIAGAKGGVELSSLDELTIGNNFKTTNSIKDKYGKTLIRDTTFTIKDY